ncbi:hypothetical protein KY328_04855 [Candidatus Woesearchaeota archaeon]|nr:hypothetical protein [Candidatus Woesearchaeota archaeon]MBW3022228.1 hypothetical protein [Candidatus Woesearchaeota archaeon]
MAKKRQKKSVKKAAKSSSDISKRTVAVLLVIAVLISVIGTWLVLTQQPEIRYQDISGSQGDAYVRFEIQGEPVPSQPVIAGGAVVGFTIE